MLDKTRKIIYIILGTLSIISLVFMLMHKVGLCASSGSDVVYVPSSSDDLPFPIYNYSPLSDSDIEACISYAYSSVWAQYLLSDYMVCVVDDNGSAYQVRVFCPEKIYMDASWSDFFSGSDRIYIDVDSGVQMYVNKISREISDASYRSADISIPYSNIGSVSPTGGNKIFSVGEIYTSYPIASNVDQWFIDSSSSSNPGDLVFSIPSSFDAGFNSDDFPEFSSIENPPSSSDPDYNLYNWLNGQNKNQYDYSKSIFDLLRGFFAWVSSPLDEDAVRSALEASEEYSLFTTVSGFHGTLTSLVDVEPAERVVIPISFSGTCFDYVPDTEINFDWYSGDIKRFIQGVLIVFMALTALTIFVKSLPSIFQGTSNTISVIERSSSK